MNPESDAVLETLTETQNALIANHLALFAVRRHEAARMHPSATTPVRKEGLDL